MICQIIIILILLITTVHTIITHTSRIMDSQRKISNAGGRKSGDEGKRQAIDTIAEFKDISPAPLSNGGTVVKSWLVNLYRVVNDKRPDMKKQDIAISLVGKKRQNEAKEEMSSGSTVPGTALWMIYDELIRKEKLKIRSLLFLLFASIMGLLYIDIPW